MSFRPLKPTSACTQQSGVRVMPKPEIAFTIGLSITLKPGIQLHSTECPAMIFLKIYVVKAVSSRNPAIRFPVSVSFPGGSENDWPRGNWGQSRVPKQLLSSRTEQFISVHIITERILLLCGLWGRRKLTAT